MKSRNGSDLWPFFEPHTVAVLGSLKEGMGHGYWALKNMLDFGFTGRLYPVNPAYSEVLGMKAYPSVNEIDAPVDLALVITPPSTVPVIIEECAKKGVKAAVIVSENFADAGGEGAKLQQRLVDITNRSEIRIIGPNTVGVFNAANGFTTIPYPFGYNEVRKGNIAYCSQTGIVLPQCQPIEDRAYPISKMCDVGNKCDVNEVDLLNYLAADRETKVAALHIEDVKNGRDFLNAARSFAERKPLIIFKPARSEAGARASASHTGSMLVNDLIYDNAIRQAGVIRANTWQEFWDIPKVFAYHSLPSGNRIAIISHSGGAGVVAADLAAESGLNISGYTDATLEKLARLSPRLARNPIDLGPPLSMVDDPMSMQEEVIATVLDDTNVDCATIILYVGTMAPASYIVQMFERLMKRVSKPLTVWFYGTKLSLIEDTSRQLEGLGVPTYIDQETSIKALGALVRYSEFKRGIE
jgi:acyl-CoA synthetase (NDP forming)